MPFFKPMLKSDSTRAVQYACLAALVIYTSGSSFLMHASRNVHRDKGLYMVSTSIFLAELGKLAISWGMEFRRLRKQDGYVALVEETPLSPLDKEGGEDGGEETDSIHDAYMASAPTDQRWTTLCRRMTKEMLSQDCMTLSLTALLYTLQYTLQLFSLSVITPATHQALMQNKVLATSLLSVFLLGRSYRWQQWASIGALCAGVAVLSLGKSSQHTPSTVQSVSSPSSSSTPKDFSPIWLIGVGSVVTASFFGSGAAVLLERVLKNGRASIWLRNAQLALFGVLISGGAVCYQSYRDGRFDPLQHFDALAWSVTLARSLGGFLIALVLQTSDAVMKGIATSLAMIFSLFVEDLAYRYRVSPIAVLGGVIVLISSYTYICYDNPNSLSEEQQQQQLHSNTNNNQSNNNNIISHWQSPSDHSPSSKQLPHIRIA